MRKYSANWRKSSYSNANDNCVEIALNSASVGVRDSKAPTSGSLHVSQLTWRAFLQRTRS